MRILDPHWKKMDPDPGDFFQIYWIFLTKQNFQIFRLFFLLIILLKIDEPFRIRKFLKISLFSINQIWILRVNNFFCSFWLIFFPLDPDPDPGTRILSTGEKLGMKRVHSNFRILNIMQNHFRVELISTLND